MVISMEYCAQMKLLHDGFAGGYSAGLSMCNGQSVAELKKISESDAAIVYENSRGHKFTVQREAEGDVIFVSSCFENNGDKPAVLEMLASFAMKGVEADTIYRMQSFWSAEGKLKKESIYDLHLERSWCGHGFRLK